jgi:hypothetical protein
MSIFPRPARPQTLIADVKRIWRASTRRYKLVFGAAAIGMTSLVITGFVLESRWGVLPEGPQIVYASDWTLNRTDDEIRKQQWADAAEKRKAGEAQRLQWKKLDDELTRHGF